MSDWINHVKKYAKTHKISYKEAMSKAKPSYKSKGKKMKGKGDGIPCAKKLCRKGIATSADFKKYAMKNHPDKPGKKDPDYSEISGCFAEERKNPGWCDRSLESTKKDTLSKGIFAPKKKGFLENLKGLFGLGMTGEGMARNQFLIQQRRLNERIGN